MAERYSNKKETMRSIFGWSYPPGVSRVPGDEEAICETCGLSAEQEPDKGGCRCLPCPECNEPGCLMHRTEQQLMADYERSHVVSANLHAELGRRYMANPRICTWCKKPLSFPDFMADPVDMMHSECLRKMNEEFEREDRAAFSREEGSLDE